MVSHRVSSWSQTLKLNGEDLEQSSDSSQLLREMDRAFNGGIKMVTKFPILDRPVLTA